MRAAMAAAEVGDDVYGEDPTVRALEERVAGLLGHEAALFTPTGSMANVLAVGSLVAPGQEVLCESSAHIARAELGAHAAVGGLTMRTWTHPRGQVDLAAITAMFAPDMGPFFVPTAAISVENTHNFAGGSGAARWRTCATCASSPTGPACAVHLDGARHLERARRDRDAAGRVRRGRGRRGGLPVQGARRAGRVADGRLRGRDRAGPRAAQAARRRDAPGRHPGGGRAPRARPRTSSGSPTTTRTPGCSPRPAGWTRRRSTPTSSSCTRADAAAYVAAARVEAGVRIAAVGPTAVRLVTHLDVSRADAEAAAAVLARL